MTPLTSLTQRPVVCAVLTTGLLVTGSMTIGLVAMPPTCREVGGEPGQALLGRDLVGRVDRGVVVEDLDLQRRQRQGRGLHLDGDLPRAARGDREVGAVDLEPVGGDGDEVLPRRQPVQLAGAAQVRLGALSDDRRRGGGRAGAGPGARVGVGGVGRPAGCRGGQALLGQGGRSRPRVAGVVGVHEPRVGRDRVALLYRAGTADRPGALHRQRDRARCGVDGGRCGRRGTCRGSQWHGRGPRCAQTQQRQAGSQESRNRRGSTMLM